MDTPSQILASKITNRLISQGLLAEDALKKIQPKLAEGTLRPEDWRLAVELAISSNKTPTEVEK